MKFLRFFFRYLPRYKGKLALYVLFTFLGALFSVFSFTAIIPILNVLFEVSDSCIEHLSWADVDMTSMKDVFQTFSNNTMFYLQQQIETKGAAYVLLMSCLFWLGMTIVKNILTYTSSLFRAPIRHGIYRDMREELFSKIIRLPVNFFASAYKGDVMSRITSDIIEVAAGIKKAFNLLIKDAINILIPVITLTTISWQLTIISLCALPLYLWAFNRLSKSVQRHTLKAQNLMGVNVSHFDQMMDGLRLIKTSATEDRIHDIFAEQNEATTWQYIIRNWIADLAYPLSEIFMIAVASLILWVGGNAVISGASALSGAVFIYFLVVLITTVSPIMSATDAFFGIRQSIACIERLEFVLNVDTSTEEMSNGNSIRVPINSIALEEVTFEYNPDVPVLKGINLSVNASGKYAIVGRSGIGKSTIIDLLFRFYDVSSGVIKINGKNIRDWDLSSLRKSISYVNQETFLFNDTILHNLTMGDPSISIEQVNLVAEGISLDKIINSMPNGYQTLVGDQGVCLSGGQKQCIAIARALLQDNSVLILDEATSALDEQTESRVLDGVGSLMKDRIVIIISHRISAIKDARCIYLLQDGTINCAGSHEELVKQNDGYRQLFQI